MRQQTTLKYLAGGFLAEKGSFVVCRDGAIVLNVISLEDLITS